MKIEKEYKDQQLEKHLAYKKAGFKLQSIRECKGIVRRKYVKSKL